MICSIRKPMSLMTAPLRELEEHPSTFKATDSSAVSCTYTSSVMHFSFGFNFVCVVEAL